MDFDRLVWFIHVCPFYIFYAFVFILLKLSSYYKFIKYAMIDRTVPEISKINGIYNSQHAVRCRAVQ